LGNPSEVKKIQVSSSEEEDRFWLSLGQTLISDTVNVLDNRAQFMITTVASLLLIDFGILVLSTKTVILMVAPQFFFALSALSFVLSLYPKRYKVNPWTPDETRHTYHEILKNKHWKHYLGFSLFFVGLILVAVSSISIFS